MLVFISSDLSTTDNICKIVNYFSYGTITDNIMNKTINFYDVVKFFTDIERTDEIIKVYKKRVRSTDRFNSILDIENLQVLIRISGFIDINEMIDNIDTNERKYANHEYYYKLINLINYSIINNSFFRLIYLYIYIKSKHLNQIYLNIENNTSCTNLFSNELHRSFNIEDFEQQDNELRRDIGIMLTCITSESDISKLNNLSKLRISLKILNGKITKIFDRIFNRLMGRIEKNEKKNN